MMKPSMTRPARTIDHRRRDRTLVRSCRSRIRARLQDRRSHHRPSWTRATPGGAKVGGGYVAIINKGTTSDKLTGGSLSVADHVEFHEMTMDGGVMQMRPITGGVEIKPGETVKFEPGGNHVMFMGLKEPLKEGDMVKGQLTFEKAGTVDIEFKVYPVGTPGPSADKSGDMSGMKGMDHMH